MFLWNLIFNRSVDSILSSINRKIEALQELAVRESAHADVKNEEIRRLEEEATVHCIAAARARGVANKLKTLVS